MLVGATGNIGSLILESLLEHNHCHEEDVFDIVVLTRSVSFMKVLQKYSNSLGSASFLHAAHIQIATVSSYTDVAAITEILRQYRVEVFICAIAAMSVNDQIHLIDACVAAPTVRRFIPSEFSVDTSSRSLVEQYIPPWILKLEVVEYLRHASDLTRGRLGWTAFVTGLILDWALLHSDVTGYDLKTMTATVFDGGGTKHEATTSAQLGRAIISIISSEELSHKTENQYIFINSFTTTQDQILNLIEQFTGRPFRRMSVETRVLFDDGRSIMDSKGGSDAYRAFQPHINRPYPKGVSEMILAGFYGGEDFGSLNQYSIRSKDLWNKVLGLPTEDLDETVRDVVERLELLKEETRSSA